MNTRTTVRNVKNKPAPATAPSETGASNSLKNRTSASDERPPLMASLPARREASDEPRADWSREDDPDVVVRPASQQRTLQGGQRRRNKDYDDEEIEPTEELRHGAHNLVKLINNVTLCMTVVTASMLAITSFSTAQQVPRLHVVPWARQQVIRTEAWKDLRQRRHHPGGDIGRKYDGARMSPHVQMLQGGDWLGNRCLRARSRQVLHLLHGKDLADLQRLYWLDNGFAD